MRAKPFLILSLALSGVVDCGLAQSVFVVLRDVPDKPSIVIIPTRWDRESIDFADKIEENILGFKIKLVQRPGAKRVTETKGGAKGVAGENEAEVGTKSLTEEYVAFEETGADFALQVDATTERVKLLRIKGRELLATIGQLTSEWTPCVKEYNKYGEAQGFTSGMEYCLFKMMESAGLPVKKVPTAK